MSRVARIVGALLLGLVGLPLLESAPAQAAPVAPEAPGFVCTPGMGVSTCATVTTIEGVLITMGMSQAAVESYIGMLLLYATGSTLDQQVAAEVLCQADASCQSELKALIQGDMQRIKEAAKADLQLAAEAEFLCELWGTAQYCEDPENQYDFYGPAADQTFGGPFGVGYVTTMPPITRTLNPGGTSFAWSATFQLTSAFPYDTAVRIFRLSSRSDSNECCSAVNVVAHLGGGTSLATATTLSLQYQMAGTMTYYNSPWVAQPWLGPGAQYFMGELFSQEEISPEHERVFNGPSAALGQHSTVEQRVAPSSPGGGAVVVSSNTIVSRLQFWSGEAPTLLQMQAKAGVVQDLPIYGAPAPSPWIDPELDNPSHVAPPAVPPSTDPEVTPTAPTLDPEPSTSPNTTIPSPSTDTEQQTNAIAGFFDNLASRIGSAFGWLGDLFGEWVQWLLRELAKWFKWLGDGIMDLLHWIGQLLNLIIDWLKLIRDGLVTMTNALVSVLVSILHAVQAVGTTIGTWLTAVVNAIRLLPGLILDGLGALLQLLFVPEGFDLAALQAKCDTAFPCSWVAEAAGALGDISVLVASGTSSCTAPVIGFDFPQAPGGRFEMTGPVPSGCSGNVPTGGEPIGDLWGYRLPIRAALSLFLWAAVVGMFIRQTPWSKGEDLPTDGLGGGVEA